MLTSFKLWASLESRLESISLSPYLEIKKNLCAGNIILNIVFICFILYVTRFETSVNLLSTNGQTWVPGSLPILYLWENDFTGTH